MKASKFRKILISAASLRTEHEEPADDDPLCRLAALLKPFEKEELKTLIQRLGSLKEKH